MRSWARYTQYKGKQCPKHQPHRVPGSGTAVMAEGQWWQKAAQQEGTLVQSLNPAQNIQPGKLQVPDWTSDPKGARMAQWQPVASGTTSRAKYLLEMHLLWMVVKVETHVNRHADQKNYLIQYALCQTGVSSCKSLTGAWHRLTGTLRSQPLAEFQWEPLHSSFCQSALQNALLLNHNIPHGLGLPKGQDLLLQLIFFIT